MKLKSEKGSRFCFKVSLKSSLLITCKSDQTQKTKEPPDSLQRFIRRKKTQTLPRSISETRYSTEPAAVCSPATTSKEYLSLLKQGRDEVGLAFSIVFTPSMPCDAMLRSFSRMRHRSHAPYLNKGRVQNDGQVS